MKVNKMNLRPFVFIWSVTFMVILTCFQIIGLKRSARETTLIINNKLSSQPCHSHKIDWETIDFNHLTPKQILEYVNWSNRSSCQLIHDFGGKMMRNPSGLDGQKAVCLEPVQLAPPTGNCLVYSFGINYEWSFDEAMANYGCEVYAFDPSMLARDHDHAPAVHFFNLGLSNRMMLTYTLLGWNLFPLSSIYFTLKSRHGERVIDYLKIDIENFEWDVIPQIIQSGMLDKIRQLAIEIHLHADESPSQMRDRVKIIRSLEKNGMIRFDSKLNPWSRTPFRSLNNTSHPFAYEIAWYNSKFLK